MEKRCWAATRGRSEPSAAEYDNLISFFQSGVLFLAAAAAAAPPSANPVATLRGALARQLREAPQATVNALLVRSALFGHLTR